MVSEKKKTIVTITLTIIQIVIILLVPSLFAMFNTKLLNSSFVGWMELVLPSGGIFFLNYHLLSPLIIKLYYKLAFTWGNYTFITNRYKGVISLCCKWLTTIKVKWGPLDTSTSIQNANLCEALLALKITEFNVTYKTIYESSILLLRKEVSQNGLKSKSLSKETVVPTAMAALILSSNYKETTQGLTKKLWDIRSDLGWGVYVDKHDDSECRLANTYWALRAIICNKSIVKSAHFLSFIRGIYEQSSDSIFGFTNVDYGKVCTTSMYLELYYLIPEDIRNKLKNYDPAKAIKFILNKFCLHNIDIEIEELPGIDKYLKTGAKKVPWKHMSYFFAISALSLAWKKKHISYIQKYLLLHKIYRMIKNDMTKVNEASSYYLPNTIDTNPDGIYTFPTAYFAAAIKKVCDILP